MSPLTLLVVVLVIISPILADDGGLLNVALNGTASQSSTMHGGDAARAIDGKTEGDWNGNSCTHSDYSVNQWWKVALKERVNVDYVEVFNRHDCCAGRIDGAKVYVVNGDTKSLCGTIQYVAGKASYSIACDAVGLVGDAVLIEAGVFTDRDAAPLTLCEVKVMAEPTSEPTSGHDHDEDEAKLYNAKLHNATQSSTNETTIDHGSWTHSSSKPADFALQFQWKDEYHEYEGREIVVQYSGIHWWQAYTRVPTTVHRVQLKAETMSDSERVRVDLYNGEKLAGTCGMIYNNALNTLECNDKVLADRVRLTLTTLSPTYLRVYEITAWGEAADEHVCKDEGVKLGCEFLVKFCDVQIVRDNCPLMCDECDHDLVW